MVKRYEFTAYDLGLESFTEDVIDVNIEVGAILTIGNDRIQITGIRFFEESLNGDWGEVHANIEWV